MCEKIEGWMNLRSWLAMQPFTFVITVKVSRTLDYDSMSRSR